MEQGYRAEKAKAFSAGLGMGYGTVLSPLLIIRAGIVKSLLLDVFGHAGNARYREF